MTFIDFLLGRKRKIRLPMTVELMAGVFEANYPGYTPVKVDEWIFDRRANTLSPARTIYFPAGLGAGNIITHFRVSFGGCSVMGRLAPSVVPGPGTVVALTVATIIEAPDLMLEAINAR